MKNILLVLLMVIFLFSCKKDDGPNNNNSYLTAPPTNISLNLNLPQYNALNFDGATVVLSSSGVGGIVVYRQSESQIFAYDLADPNHVPISCSSMTVDGLVASCPCPDDENSYAISLFGLHQGDQNANQPMLPYRTDKNGNVITITN